MNVLIAATSYPRWRGDFASVYLHRLAKSLTHQQINVHVIAPHANGLKREEYIEGVHVHRFQYMYPANLQTLAYFPGIPERIRTISGKLQLPFFFMAVGHQLLKDVKKFDIDVINAHWATPLGFLAVITKPIHKKPVVITLYGAELFPITEGKMGFLKPFTRYAINGADKVVGISDATCKAGEEISGRRDIEILPDGIDTETFNLKVNGSELKRKYGKFLFSSGRMVQRKGFIYLIRAMPAILKRFPKIKLIIGGDGPERNTLEKEVKKMGMRDKVILPGFIPDKLFPMYMKSAEVFILPSIVDRHGDTEGSATILLEAMGCGTPVVGTKVGGVPYAIKDGVGGYLVRQKNWKQISEKVISILKMRNIRRRLGKSGYMYVKNNFDWVYVARRYKNLFQTIT